MVEDLDDLDVAGVGQGDDVVPGAEPRMEAAVLEIGTNGFGEAFGISFESVRPNRENQMVDVHAPIMAAWVSKALTGPGHGPRIMA